MTKGSLRERDRERGTEREGQRERQREGDRERRRGVYLLVLLWEELSLVRLLLLPSAEAHGLILWLHAVLLIALDATDTHIE